MASTNDRRLIVFWALFLVILTLVGCSPASENLVKKAQSSPISPGSPSSSGASVQFVPSSISSQDRLVVQSYGGVIKRYAQQYELDWRLVLAVMKVESRFSHDAESEKGAAGLMQIMPATSDEVAGVLDIEDMAHPMNNIHGGVYYLRKLYNLFEGAEEKDRIELTLAAYNAGVGRIYDAQVLAAYLNDDPKTWTAIKETLPLLSKRYYTLHRSVWNQDRPKIAGWFGSSRETVNYVARVMGSYETYKSVLN